ncbi:MAG: uroporphyrinogen-III C-methyltransferase [Tatlockia sp.]|jgi:uroporphyrin-3 C-methyltransferase
MANPDDAPLNTQPKVLEPPPLTKQPLEKEKKRCGLPALAFLFSVLAIAFAGYVLLSLQSATKKTGDFYLQTEKQQDAMQVRLSHLNQRLDQSQSEVQSARDALQSAMTQNQYHEVDWLLLRARYYLELAGINAHWSENQQITVELLQQADNTLSSLKFPPVYPIRQAIAEEMAEIKALPSLDTAGILSQLNAIESDVLNAPVADAFKGKPGLSATKQETSAQSFREKLGASLKSLSSLVVVRYHDKDTEPFISPQYQMLLRESIYLNLQKAEWAVLARNALIYQQALQQAMDNITRSFNPAEESTNALLTGLQALQKVELTAKKPRIEQSLQLLNQWIDSKKTETKEGDNSQ